MRKTASLFYSGLLFLASSGSWAAQPIGTEGIEQRSRVAPASEIYQKLLEEVPDTLVTFDRLKQLLLRQR
ncbi:MAG: hypothetical protein KAT86_05900, partial [Candidatus Latescibacteria bacterium]|nr:hypothetical protein [Candidatus Latescibacterota bacterium]